MLLLLSACASINAVQPGPATGEFYVHVARWPFRRGEVLRCVASGDGDRTQTRCQRALTSDEAGELGPHGRASVAWSYASDGTLVAARGIVRIDVTGGDVSALFLDDTLITVGSSTPTDIGRHVLSVDYGDGQTGQTVVVVEADALVVVRIDVQAHDMTTEPPRRP